jgi:hypothetical protein
MSIGLQDHRKGVNYLIRACARWQPAEPADIVLAGSLSASSWALVSQREYPFPPLTQRLLPHRRDFEV